MCHERCNICKYNPIKRKNEPISNVYILVYTYEYRRIDLTTLGKQHKKTGFYCNVDSEGLDIDFRSKDWSLRSNEISILH